MNAATGIVVLVVIWWLVFFMILPIGVQKEDQLLPGQEPGAPKNPQLLKKAFYTTLITLVLFALYWLVIEPLVPSPRDW